MISRLVVIGLVCSDVLLELIVEPISKVAADTSSTMPIEYGSEPSLERKYSSSMLMRPPFRALTDTCMHFEGERKQIIGLVEGKKKRTTKST